MSVALIAEIATNHGGHLEVAKAFIDRFAEAGADFVKFQYTRVKHLRPDDPQYAWFTQAEFSDDQFAELKAYTEARGAKFLLTVYHADDVPAVAKLSTEAIKIGSGEAGDRRIWRAIWDVNAIEGNGFTRVIASRGLCRHDLPTGWEILRCVTRYPAPLSACAQRPYATRASAGDVGWSDHCAGLDACFGAIAMGAHIIEKHVQLPHQARPAKPYEATMAELRELRQFADENPERFIGRWQFA